MLGPLLDVEMSKKWNAVVARGTFGSQNVQSTPRSDHFWTTFGRRKKWTPLWREALVEIKMLKTPGVRTTFGASDVEQVDAVVARSTFWSHNMLKAPGVRTTFVDSDIASCGRRKGLCTFSIVSKTWKFCSIFNHNHPHYTPIHYTTLQLQLHLHSTTLHYTPLH